MTSQPQQHKRELEAVHRRLAALEHSDFERQRAEEARERSEERFRKIFEHSNDAIFVIDPAEDEIVETNQRASEMLGYTPEELLSTPISAIHPEEMPRLLAFSESVFQKGSGWTDELSCLTKSGELLPAEISASVIDLSGRTCIIALVRDVSQRKQAEEALQRQSQRLEELVQERTDQLRRSEERHRTLLEINNAIISQLDQESLFASISDALRKAIAFDRTSLVLHDRQRDILRVHALVGEDRFRSTVAVGTEFSPRETPFAEVLQTREPIAIDDLRRHPAHGPLEDMKERGIRSALFVPLLTRKGPLGVLAIASRKPDLYSRADIEFVCEVAEQIALAIDNMMAYREITRLKSQLEQEKFYLEEEIRIEHNFDEIVGVSSAIREVLKAIETVAPTDATVLILGETGTGKELVARAIHRLSPRKDKSLVTVNCAALPSGLIESELFGHEKGAFTGAVARKIGRFELADRGAVFLDEIGDLPLELQGKLLRVLQDGEFERVGGSGTFKVDVRVIAATNRELDKAMEEERFRPDLYYRLNVFPIRIPPLRDRRDDIPLLVQHFAMRYGTKLGKKIENIPVRTMDALVNYAWPGNVRELANIVERAVIVSRSAGLQVDDFLPQAGKATRSVGIPTLQELERQHILEVLEQTLWRVSGPKGAARILGLKPTTLEARMKKLGIKRPGG